MSRKVVIDIAQMLLSQGKLRNLLIRHAKNVFTRSTFQLHSCNTSLPIITKMYLIQDKWSGNAISGFISVTLQICNVLLWWYGEKYDISQERTYVKVKMF